jgi:hypothetical protein
MALSPNRTSLFSQITVTHGPAPLLGRSLLKAEDAALRRGVRLSFASLNDLLQLNRNNRDTWLPLISLFDPTLNDLSEDQAFCILGSNKDGEIVAAQAGRLYDWPDTSYHEEASNLRLLYTNPSRSKLPDEGCRVSALAAKGITGRVLFSGAAWYRPDYRGCGLVEILPRIARAYAYTRWNTDCTVTMMSETNFKKGVFPRNGYRNAEWDVQLINSRMGTIRFVLLWIKPDEMLDDLGSFLDHFDAEIDGVRASGTQ